MATDEETAEWLAPQDFALELRRGLRLCLFCGDRHRIPGWLHFDPDAGPREPGAVTGAADEQRQRGAADDGLGLAGGVAIAGWRMEMRLAFVPDASVSFITLGPALVLDWSARDAIADLEALVDDLWRILEPGGHLRVVRPMLASPPSPPSPPSPLPPEGEGGDERSWPSPTCTAGEAGEAGEAGACPDSDPTTRAPPAAEGAGQAWSAMVCGAGGGAVAGPRGGARWPGADAEVARPESYPESYVHPPWTSKRFRCAPPGLVAAGRGVVGGDGAGAEQQGEGAGSFEARCVGAVDDAGTPSALNTKSGTLHTTLCTLHPLCGRSR